MGSSSSSLGQRNTFKFLLTKRVPEHGEIFEDVPESDLQPGDIVLFPKNSSSGATSSIFKHAVVYYGDGEVVHLQKTKKRGVRIIKEGFNAVKRNAEKIQIYRKKGGINLNDFKERVKDAMNGKAKYNLIKNNCIHFALSLLDLMKFYMEPEKTPDEDGDKSVVKSRNGGNGKKRQKCIVM